MISVAAKLLDQINDPIVSFDAAGQVRYQNAAASKLLLAHPGLLTTLVPQPSSFELPCNSQPITKWVARYYLEEGAGVSALLSPAPSAYSSDSLFQTAFAHAPVGMVITAPDGTFLEANEAYLQMLGYTREELASRDSAHFTHPDDIDKTLAFGDKLRRGQPTGVLEKRYFRKDGAVVWARASGSMQYDVDGRPVQFVAIIEDVTERKRMEQALIVSELRLTQVFAQAPVAVVLMRGPELMIELANPAYQALLPGRRLIGEKFFDAVPELEPEVREALRDAFTTGEPFVRNDYYVSYDQNGDGELEDHWFNVVYHPLRESDGTVSGLVHHQQ